MSATGPAAGHGTYMWEEYDRELSNTPTAWENIKGTINEKGGGIKGGIGTALEGIKSAISGATENAKSVVSGALEKIKGFFSGCKLEFVKIVARHRESER